MEFFDLVFPMKLGPLTYKKPAGMEIAPGMIVTAELKKSIKKAVVLRPAKEGFSIKNNPRVKEINGVYSPEGSPVILPPPILRLISWMAEYYMAPEGTALKTMYGDALFEKANPRGKPGRQASPEIPSMEISGPLLRAFLRQEDEKRLPFLLKAPETRYEREFIRQAVAGHLACEKDAGVIVLVPELSRVPFYEAALKEALEALEALAPGCGEKLCLLHGGLTKSWRLKNYERILRGEVSVVLGTRMAVFAPFRKTTLVIVAEEENPNYKNSEAVRYNARDVAVMRAFFEEGAGEKATKTLLSSICPSAESWMNQKKGKYRLLDGDGRIPGPGIKLVFMRKAEKAAGTVSKALYEAISTHLRKGSRAAIVLNRLGHSVLLCEDCGRVERCPGCGAALVLHKAEKGLHCHVCGFKRQYGPDVCQGCGGHNLKALGAGLERLREDIKKLFPGFKAGADGPAAEGSELLISGTKKIVKGPDTGFPVMGLVNPEAALFQPHFRAAERLFAELSYAMDKLLPAGTLIVQTEEPAFFKDRMIKDGSLDYERFMKTELGEREPLGYPPYLKMAAISAEGLRPGSDMPPLRGGAATVLGPAVLFDRKRKKKIHSILVKAPDSRTLRAAVSDILAAMRAGKIVIDIDPI